MLDISSLNIRRFDVKIEGQTISLNPPKIKVLRKLINASKNDDIDEIIGCIVLIFNNNGNNKKFNDEWVEDNLTYDEMTILLKKYFEWVAEIQNNPN